MRACLISVVSGLRIIHTNDIHAHYDQSNVHGLDCTANDIRQRQCYGGLARLKTAIDQLRSHAPESLLLDAGDQFQGTLFYTHYKGNVTWKAMNKLKYDAMAVGNHEFDDGPDNLARVARRFRFPLVSSNIDASRHPRLRRLIRPHVLFPKQRVALVGYITEKVASIGTLGNLTLFDTLASVQAEIDRVRSLGYTRVIALSHAGYAEDVALASKLTGLALIVGGHSHSYLAPERGGSDSSPPSQGLYPTPVRDRANRTVYVVQAYWKARFVGHIDVRFGKDGYLTSIIGAPIDLDATVKQDAGMEARVQRWRRPFDAYTRKVIGVAGETFDRQSCRSSECSLGDLVTDAMSAYHNADLAILNSGDIRSPIPRGQVYAAGVLAALPYHSQLVEIRLQGSHVWQLIEGVVSRQSPYNNGKVSSSIQVSRLRFSYNASAAPYQRLRSVQIRTRQGYFDLDNATSYRVATTDFVANNGNNILPSVSPPPAKLIALSDLLIRYFTSHSPLYPEPLSRIIRLN